MPQLSQEQLAFFDHCGYLVLENGFDADEITRMQAESVFSQAPA